MGVILQAAYRQAVGVSVPAPVDAATPDVDWFYDHVAEQAHAIAAAGFTALLLPPVLKTSDGSNPGADGYGPYDDYDIGNKSQAGSVGTRFGSRLQLQRLCAMLRANGVDVYADMVPHQRSGGAGGVYRYLGADNKTLNGRFPKNPGCFFGPQSRGFVDRDPIAGPVADDFAFGDELCPVNATPKGYVQDGLNAAGDWLTKSLDLQGFRIDDTKGQAIQAVQSWTNYGSMAGKIAIGEYDDGNPDNLAWWVWSSGLNGRCYAFDFSTHYMIESMCNNTSRWDMRQLQQSTFASRCPMQAVTFVENPDTDTDGFATVIFNKRQGYFWLLTTPGYPCVYYKDWSQDNGCYGLAPDINNYIWIHERIVNKTGDLWWRFADYQAVVYERQPQSGPGLLCGINNNMYDGWRPITVQTSFGPNAHLQDYTGHANDIWTDDQGRATVWLPPNDNGGGTVAYSIAGLGAPITIVSGKTTQVFFGAADLDIPPAAAKSTTFVGEIYVAAGSIVTIKGQGTPLLLSFALRASGSSTSLLPNIDNSVQVQAAGMYLLEAINDDSVDIAFEVGVTFQAPKTMVRL